MGAMLGHRLAENRRRRRDAATVRWRRQPPPGAPKVNYNTLDSIEHKTGALPLEGWAHAEACYCLIFLAKALIKKLRIRDGRRQAGRALARS
jgi:hypothetical protein